MPRALDWNEVLDGVENDPEREVYDLEVEEGAVES